MLLVSRVRDVVIVRLWSVTPYLLYYSQQMSAGKAYRQADAFDATFESKYLAFQLFCRGVQALRNALRRRKAADDVPGQISSTAEASASLSQEGQVGKLDDIDSFGRFAEAYLVKTRGASLAALITSRECEKLVSRCWKTLLNIETRG